MRFRGCTIGVALWTVWAMPVLAQDPALPGPEAELDSTAAALAVERRRLALLARANELGAMQRYATVLSEYGEALDALVPYWPLLEPLVQGDIDTRLATALAREWTMRQQPVEITIPPEIQGLLDELDTPLPPPIEVAQPFRLEPRHVRIVSCGSTQSGPLSMIQSGQEPAVTVYQGESYRGPDGQPWLLESVRRRGDDTIRATFLGPEGQRVQVEDVVGTAGTRNCEANYDG